MVIILEPNPELPFWYNDTKGDASIWATRFNGLRSSEDMLIEEEGYVGIKIGEVYCVSGYYSPNVGINSFVQYVERFDISIDISTAARRCKEVIVAGDFNAKSKARDGAMMDRRADAVGGSGQEPPCSYWDPDWLHISKRLEEDLPGYNECEL